MNEKKKFIYTFDSFFWEFICIRKLYNFFDKIINFIARFTVSHVYISHNHHIHSHLYCI